MTQYANAKFASQVSSPTTIGRARLLFALTLLTVANASIGFVYGSILTKGLAIAAIRGLGMSWAFWASWGLALGAALRAEPTPADRSDVAVAAVCVAAVLFPNHHLSTVSATLAGGWFAFRPGSGVKLRAAALILLALSVNLLWARVAMLVFARPIEFADAHMVGAISSAPVHANIVHFVRGGGSYLLATGCTSVENASMALLMWIAIARSLRPAPRASDWLIAAGILISVVAINLVRLSLMAQSMAMFEFWHGLVGGTFVNLLITIVGLAWAALDVRHELFS